MENWDLERKVDRAKDIIDDLVAEIESLEKDNKELQNQIGDHLETIEQLRQEIYELQSSQS